MKEEGKQKKAKTQSEIEAEYKLEQYPKCEYTTAIFREFYKFGIKLHKIAAHEESLKQGKVLDKEAQELVDKKEQFTSHLESLKKALELYKTSVGKQEIVRNVDAEVNQRTQENIAESSSLLSFFFAVGSCLTQKEKLAIDPFASCPALKENAKNAIARLYRIIACIHEDKETTINKDAGFSLKALKNLLTKGCTESIEPNEMKFSELQEALKKAMLEKPFIDCVFMHKEKAEVPKMAGNMEQLFSQQPASQYVAPQATRDTENKMAPPPGMQQAQMNNAYVAPVQPVVPAPTYVNESAKAPANVEDKKEVGLKAAIAPTKENWAELDEEEDYEEKGAYDAKKAYKVVTAQEPKEEEWEIAGEEGKDKRERGGRGNPRFRGRGGRFRRGEGNYGRRPRGEFRGESRGRGRWEGRGDRRGGRTHARDYGGEGRSQKIEAVEPVEPKPEQVQS